VTDLTLPEVAVMPDAPAVPTFEVRDLALAYKVRGRDRQVLRGVSFSIARGESYGLVGESGCGKSTVALAAVRFLSRNGRVNGGSITFEGEDVLAMSRSRIRKYRSNGVAMVYQNPGTALNPTLRIDRQLDEALRMRGVDRGAARARSLELLHRVRFTDPDVVLRRYPHQLSGGMQQRVVIAMALATDPGLLILDEPTTGLDATVEAEVLDLVAELRQELGTAILLISHNLGVIARTCERVGVLYAGRLVEEGPTQEVLHGARHPYTVGLLRCIPRAGRRKGAGPLDTIAGNPPPPGAKLAGCVFVDRCAIAEGVCRDQEPALVEEPAGHLTRCHFPERAHLIPHAAGGPVEPAMAAARGETPLIRIDDVSKIYHSHGREIVALTGVDLELWAGETLGLVGESGSGKTTLAHILLGLVESTAGTVELDGKHLGGLIGDRKRDQIRDVQIVFQNPDSALNRRHTVRRIMLRALRRLAATKGKAASDRARDLVESVRLPASSLSVRPGQLSGGQKQRVAIARAFAGTPKLVVCDEPTSALDVSVQAAILNLLVDLQTRQQVGYLFISHDLGVVRYLSDRIAVLYRGRLLELGPAADVFSGPHHPYTEVLLAAAPTIDSDLSERVKLHEPEAGVAPSPTGCVFAPRCPRKIGPICDEQPPPAHALAPDHVVLCHLPTDELGRASEPSPIVVIETG